MNHNTLIGDCWEWITPRHGVTPKDYLKFMEKNGESVDGIDLKVLEDSILQQRFGRPMLSEDPEYSLYKEISARTTMRWVEAANEVSGGGSLKMWPWRVLVNGEVQSGKTTSYSNYLKSLVDDTRNKRYGAPENLLIVVLSGVHEKLRWQTQKRLRDDLDGEDIHWLTDERDIQRNKELKPGINIIVAKKVKAPMSKVNKIIQKVEREDKYMLVVIDDECDQISVDLEVKQMPNTNLVREMIWGTEADCKDGVPHEGKFSSGVLYIGYSATPFANALQDINRNRSLFPETYVAVIEPGEDYCGYDHYWPSDRSNAVVDVPESESSDRREEDDDSFKVAGTSLETAFLWFVLAAAGRRSLGSKKSSTSMLVNSHTKIALHERMKESLNRYLSDFRKDWSRDKQSVLSKLSEAWEIGCKAGGTPEKSLEECLEHVEKVIGNVKILVDNSRSTDRPEYPENDGSYDPDQPYEVVVVGGYTLSRGITLYGLVSSYFTRKMELRYDSHLQAMRWMGYRGNYKNFCRVWMDKVSSGAFSEIAKADRGFKESLRNAVKSKSSSRGASFDYSDVAIPLNDLEKILPAAKNKLESFIRCGYYKVGAPQEIHLYDPKSPNWVTTKNFPTAGIEQLMTTDEVLNILNNYVGPDEKFKNLIKFVDDFRGDIKSEWVVYHPETSAKEERRAFRKTETRAGGLLYIKTLTDEKWRERGRGTDGKTRPLLILKELDIVDEAADLTKTDFLAAVVFYQTYGKRVMKNSSTLQNLENELDEERHG
jgi:hypothetical protein